MGLWLPHEGIDYQIRTAAARGAPEQDRATAPRLSNIHALHAYNRSQCEHAQLNRPARTAFNGHSAKRFDDVGEMRPALLTREGNSARPSTCVSHGAAAFGSYGSSDVWQPDRCDPRRRHLSLEGAPGRHRERGPARFPGMCNDPIGHVDPFCGRLLLIANSKCIDLQSLRRLFPAHWYAMRVQSPCR